MKLLLCADTIIQYNINNDKFLHYSTSKAPLFFSKTAITINRRIISIKKQQQLRNELLLFSQLISFCHQLSITLCLNTNLPFEL